MPRVGALPRARARKVCDSGTQTRSRLKQGIPAALGLLWSIAAQACGANAPRLETLIDGSVWWVRAERGDADAANRGRVSNLLIVRDGTQRRSRVWAVGSGPTRAFARALDCVVQREVGQPVTDVISPWPHPELVLGAAGLPRARHWAHAEVAQAMRVQCARCLARLRQRLGTAAADLGADNTAVRLPERVLSGDHGALGPFDWWRVERAPGVTVTLWQVRGSGVMTAHGLLWAGAVPDLRDSTLASMQSATQRLAVAARGASMLLGEQGAPSDGAEVQAHLAYWSALDAAVLRAQQQAQDATAVPESLPGVEPARTRSTAHALNWQRAWRQAEDAALRP